MAATAPRPRRRRRLRRRVWARLLLLVAVWLDPRWLGRPARAWELKALPVPGGPAITYYHLQAPAPATAAAAAPPPLLCVHPVGVGMAGWFWRRLAAAAAADGAADARRRREVYAIQLPGCGGGGGGDDDDDDDRAARDAFAAVALEDVPATWHAACQALLEEVLRRHPGAAGGCQVLVQGGLAPVGVDLAASNSDAVSSLILASPPTWEDMTTPVPWEKIRSNYDFLNSPLLGDLAFRVLESRCAVRTFSDAFLFRDPCDDAWVDGTLRGAGPAARPAVRAFNAGVCQRVSHEAALRALTGPLCVLQGDADTQRRREGREPYRDRLTQTRVVLQTLPGKSLLPWESPEETWRAIQQFTFDTMKP